MKWVVVVCAAGLGELLWGMLVCIISYASVSVSYVKKAMVWRVNQCTLPPQFNDFDVLPKVWRDFDDYAWVF